MKKSWIYIDRKGNAGLPTRPPRFKDLGEHSIGIFIRELLQNSLDARFDDKRPVKIKIKVEDWDRTDIEDFFNLIGKDHLEKYSESYNYAITDVKPKMSAGQKIITGEKKKTFALTIEENNCIGLTGSVKGIDRRSNFNSLIRKVDDNEAKKELSNSGGTWGKGSSVFIYSSELWMWFCYTLLSIPNNVDDGKFQYRRFIGRSILSPYYSQELDKSYWGDGWFCKPDTDSFPYVNDDADSFAELFGLEKRITEPGTTFFIPFFNTFLDSPTLHTVIKEFHDQILMNWYIPIYNGDLIISISDKKGEIYKIDKTYLGKIEQLKFKLEILNWYNNDCPPDENFIRETYEVEVPALKKDYINKNNLFAAEKNKISIDLVIRKIRDDEESNNEWETCNKVALTRNRGMLITDHLPFELNSIRTESILFGGLLCKSEKNSEKKKHLDLFLAYSENPAHNKWCTKSQDYNSCFLDFFEGRRPSPESYINKIFDEIYKSFKKLFDQEQQPETSKDICSLFKKIAKLKLSGGITGGPRLFVLRTPADTSNPIIDENGRYNFRYLIKSNCNDRAIEVGFKTSLNSLEGEISADFNVLGIGDFKNIEILNDDKEVLGFSENPTITLGIMEERIIRIRTCKIHGIKIFKNFDPIIKSSAKKIDNE
jgi:hypothetical protein